VHLFLARDNRALIDIIAGGTADRRMRFWNTLTGQLIHNIDTGSQVCNVAWSKHSCELVSTHGYSQNQVVIWKYPSLQQVTKLTGHTFRVLYLVRYRFCSRVVELIDDCRRCPRTASRS
jgi:WD40 repeat protein